MNINDQIEWISVEDRLPLAFESVLVHCPLRKKIVPIEIGYWIDRKDFKPGLFWSINGTSGGTLEQINNAIPTHWMPLPEPPEAMAAVEGE